MVFNFNKQDYTRTSITNVLIPFDLLNSMTKSTIGTLPSNNTLVNSDVIKAWINVKKAPTSTERGISGTSSGLIILLNGMSHLYLLDESIVIIRVVK